MKVLINSNYKALRTGEFVVADETVGEFIFNTDDCELSVATLLEIAAANKISAKKDKKENVVEVLEDGLSKMKLPVQNERPVTDVVDEIVRAGVAAGKSDDEMLIEIVQAGVKFKQAGKLFTQVMTVGGYRVSNKERKVAIRAILVEADFEPETYQEVQDMLVRICKEVPDTELGQALQGVRQYSKEFEIELPKPEKKVGGGFRNIVRDAVIKNPLLTLEEFKEICVKSKRDADKMEKTTWPQVVFAKAVAKAAIKLELESTDFNEA